VREDLVVVDLSNIAPPFFAEVKSMSDVDKADKVILSPEKERFKAESPAKRQQIKVKADDQEERISLRQALCFTKEFYLLWITRSAIIAKLNTN